MDCRRDGGALGATLVLNRAAALKPKSIFISGPSMTGRRCRDAPGEENYFLLSLFQHSSPLKGDAGETSIQVEKGGSFALYLRPIPEN